MNGTLLKFVPGKGPYGKHSQASGSRYVIRVTEGPFESIWGHKVKGVVVACNAEYCGEVNDKVEVVLSCFEPINF